MLKHLNFFVLFCLFVCLVFVGGGGGEGAHASREKRREDNSSDFEYF